MALEIKVQVDDLNLDTEVGRQYDPDDDHYRPQTLADLIVEELVTRVIRTSDYRTIAEKVNSIRTEIIRERVAAEVEEALTTPFTVTNTFGEPTGAVTTLRQYIASIAQAAVKMDHRQGYADSETTAVKVIRTEVGRAFAKELEDVVKAEKAKVIAAVRNSAGTIIADAVARGLAAR